MNKFNIQIRCRLAVIAVLAASSALADVQFRGIGLLPGSTSNSPSDISANGAVVIGQSRFSDHSEAYRWSAETGIVSLDSVDSTASGASADGSIVVGTRTFASGPPRAFRWTAPTGIVVLPNLPGFSTPHPSRGQGISPDGNVIVGNCQSPLNLEQVATRWTSFGIQALDNVVSADCSGVSVNGSVIVGSRYGGVGPEAFRWTGATGMVALGALPGGRLESYGSDVSDDGLVIVGGANYNRNSGNLQAFRWTSEHGMVGLGFLPGNTSSYATGVSDDGTTIVGYGGSANTPFIWTLGRGMRPLRTVLETDYGLNLADWTLGMAKRVSADGTAIVGEGARQGLPITWLVSGLPLFCIGDLDGDRVVDLADLSIMLSGFGCQSGPCVDLTGDGQTALDDLALLLQKFGTDCD